MEYTRPRSGAADPLVCASGTAGASSTTVTTDLTNEWTESDGRVTLWSARSTVHCRGTVLLRCGSGEALFGGGVDGVLRHHEALLDDRLDRVGGEFDAEVHFGPFGFGEVLEDVVGRVLAAGRAPDAEPDAGVVLG